MPLTDEQMNAISSPIVHRLFVAGPGTGKSETILGFIEKAVSTDGIDPNEIFVLAFTRAATADLRKKISKLFEAGTKTPRVQTLHGFSLRQVMKNSHAVRALPSYFSIADDFDERHIIQEDLKRFLRLDRIEVIRNLFNKLSANWETLNADRTGWQSDFESPEFIGAWLEHREVYGYVLRSELVYQLKNILTLEPNPIIDGPITYLIVDEYQDLNRCDLRVIHELAKKGAHLVCAGDDDQSIYAFRYAFPEGIRLFSQDVVPSDQFVFTRCFRCDSAILNLALLVIRQDYARVPKRITSVTGERGITKILRFDNQQQEAAKIADICIQLRDQINIRLGEIIVLLRSNRYEVFSTPIEEAFLARGLAVITRKDLYTVFDQDDGRYLTALVKLAINPTHDLAFRTIIQLTPGIGPTTIDEVYRVAKDEKKRFAAIIREIATGDRKDIRVTKELSLVLSSILGTDILQRVRQTSLEQAMELLMGLVPSPSPELADYIREFIMESGVTTLDEFVLAVTDFFGPKEQVRVVPDAVRIMTMHQAKGLSADAVFVVGVEEEYIPGRGSIDEERRLLYVSLTRARHYLFLTHCINRYGRQSFTGFSTQKGSRRHISRFIANLPGFIDDKGDSFSLSTA
jgi:DNA helicase-2/ATP-dependent DNA helicase PcrA